MAPVHRFPMNSTAWWKSEDTRTGFPRGRGLWRSACETPDSTLDPDYRSTRVGYAAHGPVPVGRSGPLRAWLTTSLGTPSPPGGPLSLAEAKTVVSTSPDPSTTGPPELPLRTCPRNGVILRWVGPRP